MLQGWFEKQNKDSEVLTWLLISPDLHTVNHLWDVLDKHVTSMRYFLSPGDQVLTDTTADLQGSSGVQASTTFFKLQKGLVKMNDEPG